MTTRSQISITLVFLALFPVDPDARLLGFPLHYALALLAGPARPRRPVRPDRQPAG